MGEKSQWIWAGDSEKSWGIWKKIQWIWLCQPGASRRLNLTKGLGLRVKFPSWESKALKIWAKKKRLRFDLWVGKIPWRRKWQLTPVFLSGKFRGQRTLVGYSPWGCRVGHNWHTHTKRSEEEPGLRRLRKGREEFVNNRGWECLWKGMAIQRGAYWRDRGGRAPMGLAQVDSHTERAESS